MRMGFVRQLFGGVPRFSGARMGPGGNAALGRWLGTVAGHGGRAAHQGAAVTP